MRATGLRTGGARAVRRSPEGEGTASRIAAAAAVAWLIGACSGAAGPGGGGGVAAGGEPIIEPVPATELCQGPALPDPSTRSSMIENAATLAEPRNASEWSSFADADLGVGHLALDAPAGEAPGGDYYYDWAQHVVFPLFNAPAGEHIGWFDQGWVVLGFGYDRLHRQGSGAGQVETDYEQQTLIVYETTPDGWYRIRHTEPRRDEPGTAWVHRCHLKGSAVSLSFVPWEERFREIGGVPVFFRSEVRHSLRAGPTTDAERVAWIPADVDDSQIEILEFAADWARVRVEQPRTWCGDEDVDVSVEEGWIKWRDEEKGPWIWWYTRGC